MKNFFKKFFFLPWGKVAPEISGLSDNAKRLKLENKRNTSKRLKKMFALNDFLI